MVEDVFEDVFGDGVVVLCGGLEVFEFVVLVVDFDEYFVCV